eukprot:6187769-Pleurochrysis_carterae.AAC.4
MQYQRTQNTPAYMPESDLWTLHQLEEARSVAMALSWDRTAPKAVVALGAVPPNKLFPRDPSGAISSARAAAIMK